MSKLQGMTVETKTQGEYAPTLRDLAVCLSISSSTAKNLRRDGLRVHRRGYHVEEARRLLNVRAMRARNIAASPDALRLKTQKLELDVERARFELEVSKGEWIRKVDVIRAWRMNVIRARDRFKHLGKTVAPLCANRGPVEIEGIITTRVYEILRGLARSKEDQQLITEEAT